MTPRRKNEQRAKIQYLLSLEGRTQRDVLERARQYVEDGEISEGLVSLVFSGDRRDGEKVRAIQRAAAELTRTPRAELFAG